MRLRFPAFCFYVAGILFLMKGLALDIAGRKLDVAAFAIGMAALGVWRMPRAGTNWRGRIGRCLAALGILAAISALILLLSFTLPKPREGGTLLLFHIPISIGAILLVTGWILRCWENSNAHHRWRISFGLALAWYPIFGVGASLGWGGGYWPAGLLWLAQGWLLWPPKLASNLPPKIS